MATKTLTTGPELDRAVALVIYAGGQIDHPGHPANGRLYSTDPRYIEEMLAWLHQHDNVTLDIAPDGIDARTRYKVDVEDAGKTIPEALSRLVVAVKEASDG